MSLSERQAAAVTAPPGGLFVSAAAGSGKTRVLTARFVRHAAMARASGATGVLERLVAITFTEKAAGELSQRVRGALARDVGVDVAREAERAWISTIHGMCRRLLTRHAFEAGLDPMFSVMDEVQSALVRQQAFERAVSALSGSDEVQRLIADYDVLEIEGGIRTVDEHLRSLGRGADALQGSATDVAPALADARSELRSVLDEMLGLTGRGVTEERNIEHLANALQSLETVDTGESECGASILGALVGFKQSKGCRTCAKPLAIRAEEQAARLREVAAEQVSDGYAAGFVELLRRASAEYASAKEKLGALDFEDLQLKTRDLLRAHPELVRRYRRLLTEVMVDEFQDTNELQLSVVAELAGGALATVGDEKQSIYGWRNADVGVFRRRLRALPGERVFTLPENFRSHPELVRFFNGLFSSAPFWPEGFVQLEVGERDAGNDPERDSWPDDFPRIELTVLDADACSELGRTVAEAEAVAEHFARLRREGVQQSDLVLLLRAMTRSEAFESALSARGFDVFVASGGTYFDTPETEELEALLRVVGNSADDEAFARMLVGRMANVSDDALYVLRTSADGRSLWETASDENRPTLVEEDETALRTLLAAVGDVRREQGRTSLYDLIHRACEQLDYDVTLFAAGEERAWANVLKFARLAGEFEQLEPGDPSAFLAHLELRRRHRRYEQQAAMAAEDVDAVRIMSVHSAKGLEFPVVALAELGNQPPRRSLTFDCGSPAGQVTLGLRLPVDEPFASCRDTRSSAAVREWRTERETAESKRVLYVACTRATQALALFGVADLTKELLPDRPIGWICEAIGVDAAVPASEREPIDGRCGEARLRLNCARPAGECTTDEKGVAARKAEGATRPAGMPPAAPDESSAPGGPTRVSYTGLQTYLDCPFRYYATYVARVGRLSYRGIPGDARAIGTVVHQALSVLDDQGRPPAGTLEAMARREGLCDEDLDRVRRAVTAFAASPLARAVSSAGTVLREVPFGVAVSETVVDGAIDLLALDGREALVVDYKTGVSAPDSFSFERWRLQSACYALAVFSAQPNIEHLEAVFFKLEAGGEETRFSYRREDLREIETEISGIVSDIGRGVFPPLGHYQPRTCDECPAFHSLCPVEPGRAPGQVSSP